MEKAMEKLAQRLRNGEWRMCNAFKKAEKSERLANFSLGFSVFTLILILVIELLIKK